MINLMPDEAKRQLRAARANVLLLRYLFIVLAAAGFLAFAIAGAYYLLGQTQSSARALIAASDTEAGAYSDTKNQVDQLSAQLSEARDILNNEVAYSNVLINIGQLLPTGTLVDDIDLNAASFDGTPVTMTIFATNTDAAVAARERFQKSSYFSSVNFQSVSEGDASIPGYPVSAEITLTINRTIAQ
jgi:hypothetical protein